MLNTYNSLGILYKYQGNFDKALHYYQSVIDLSKEMNNVSMHRTALNNIAIINQELGKTDEALQYYKQALEIAGGTKDKDSKATYLNNIGGLYLIKKDFKNADKFLSQAYKIALEINDIYLLKKIYEGFSENYLQIGDYKKALEYYKLQNSVSDSLNSIEINEAIAELQTKYDTEKKEKEIEILTKNSEIQNLKLAKQKNRLDIIIIIAVLVIIFAIIIYQTKQKQIKAQKKVEAEIKKMNKQLEQRVREELKKREHQQQQLIQKSKLESIGKLAAGIAHEINQPLGGISMGLENIWFAHTDGRLTEQYLEEKLQHIDGYFDRIKQIIDHIRIFSRDQKSVLFEDVDINKTVRDALSLLQTQYENHNVELQVQLSDSIPNISGNKFKLEQVVLNLLTNAKDAVDFKKQNTRNNYKKKIIIKTYETDRDLVIEIEDNGIGISEENIKNIFDPFFTTKDPAKGTGLGLSIIYGIIREMNGEIFVESKEGEFTRMKVELRK